MLVSLRKGSVQPGNLAVSISIQSLVGWNNTRFAPESVGFIATPSGSDLPTPVDYNDGGVYDERYHELKYEWWFDDVEERFKYLVNVEDSKNNTNYAKGPYVQHTFKQPGTYYVRCRVTDPKTGFYRDHTIPDPIVVVPITDKLPASVTQFVDPTGVNADMPVGATPHTSIESAIDAILGDNTHAHRIMLAWGCDTTMPVGKNFNGTGSIVITPPDTGSGARPIIRGTQAGSCFPLDGMGGTFQAYGVDFRGTWNVLTETGEPNTIMFQNTSNLRLFSLHDCTSKGLQDLYNSSSQDFNEQRWFINDCDITEWLYFGLGEFSAPTGTNTVYKAVVGCAIAQNPRARAGNGAKFTSNSHGPMRIRSSDWMCILICDFFTCTGWTGLGTDPDAQAHQPCIRINSTPRAEQHGIGNFWGNTFEGGNFVAEMGPKDDSTTTGLTFPTNFIFHDCIFIGDHQTHVFIGFGAGGASVKNCLFFRGDTPTLMTTNGGNPSAFVRDYKTSGANAAARNSPIFVDFCTFVSLMSDANTSSLFGAGADRGRYDMTATGEQAANLNFIIGDTNVFYQPNVPSSVDTGTPFLLTDIIGADGVTPITPRSLGYTPSTGPNAGTLDTAVATDPNLVKEYALDTGSTAIGDATPTAIDVNADYKGTVRTSPKSRGAVEA